MTGIEPRASEVEGESVTTLPPWPPAPGSKKGCSLDTTVEGLTGSTGTANDLLRSKASSRENLSLHLPSKLLRSSEVGLLLGFLLLDLGEPLEPFSSW